MMLFPPSLMKRALHSSIIYNTWRGDQVCTLGHSFAFFVFVFFSVFRRCEYLFDFALSLYLLPSLLSFYYYFDFQEFSMIF